jgi:integrase
VFGRFLHWQRGAFYWRPLAGGIRYGDQVLVINKIKGLKKERYTGQAGLVENITSHSGNRTCAKQLYQASVDEQDIISRTGHRSETAVRKYKRSNSVLQEKNSKVLDSP